MVGCILRKLVTIFCALALVGFLLTDLLACFTIVLGIFGHDMEALSMGILAAVVFGYATWKFANIFVDRIVPPDDANRNE